MEKENKPGWIRGSVGIKFNWAVPIEEMERLAYADAFKAVAMEPTIQGKIELLEELRKEWERIKEERSESVKKCREREPDKLFLTTHFTDETEADRVAESEIKRLRDEKYIKSIIKDLDKIEGIEQKLEYLRIRIGMGDYKQQYLEDLKGNPVPSIAERLESLIGSMVANSAKGKEDVLVRFGFMEMPKVKELSNDRRQLLIRYITSKDSRVTHQFKLYLLTIVGFWEWVEENRGTANKGEFEKEVGSLLGCTDRTVRGWSDISARKMKQKYREQLFELGLS